MNELLSYTALYSACLRQKYKMQIITLFVVSRSMKKFDCVDIYFSQSMPDFGVSTGIMLYSRHLPLVVQVGLWTLARK